MFIENQELETMLDSHVIDEITGDGRNEIVTSVLLEATATVKAFLHSRYDVSLIFEAEGEERNYMIVRYVKVIAVWYLLLRCNADTLLSKWEEEYVRVINSLKELMSGKPSPDLPLRTDADGNPVSPLLFTSNKKFSHYY
jgi:phage gp36-like protein